MRIGVVTRRSSLLAALSGCSAAGVLDIGANRAPTLADVSLFPEAPSEATTLACIPGKASDPEGDEVSFQFAWRVNGEPIGVEGSSLTGARFDRDDRVECLVTPTDGLQSGSAVTSAARTIVNDVPTITGVMLAPADPLTGDVLTATSMVRDQDPGDVATLQYEWFRGEERLPVSGRTLDGSEWFTRGDAISVRVTASDGSATSEPVTSEPVVVGNSPPSAAAISFGDRSTVPTAGRLTCFIDAPSTDADGDEVSYQFAWTRNGAGYSGPILAVAYPGDTIPEGELASRDSWACEVTVSDGELSQTTRVEQSFCGDLGCTDFKLIGQTNTDAAGTSLAGVGDLDGDGYGDLLIGAPENNSGGVPLGGAIYVYYGAESGLYTGSLRGADAKLQAENTRDLMGTAVTAAGDVNGDGFADALVGVARADVSGVDEGMVFLILGGTERLRTSGTTLGIASIAEAFTGTEEYGRAGAVVAGLGDVNADGYADFGVTSARGRRVSIIHGAADLAGRSLAEADSEVTGLGDGSYDKTLSLAAAGDVDGDGYADVLAGDGTANLGSETTYLFRGSRDGVMAGDAVDADASWTEGSPYAGGALSSAGDIDADGYDDVLIGAPYAESDEGAVGKVYVLLGSASGPASGVLPDVADATLVGSTPRNYAGVSLSPAGDVDRDGFDDFLVGSYRYFNGDKAFTLVYGSAAGIADGLLVEAGISFDQDETFSNGAHIVNGAGDIDGDGYPDLLVGVPGDDTVEYNAGAAYLILGSGL